MDESAGGAADERPSLRAEWPFVAALAAWFAVAAVAVRRCATFPVIDDWTYAWSVEQLLHHGRLRHARLERRLPGRTGDLGRGVVAGLRLLVRDPAPLDAGARRLVGCGALYLILRELEASPRVALLGALSVAANPVFLLLSSSFMTDVPFVALHAAGAAVLRPGASARRGAAVVVGRRCGPA